MILVKVFGERTDVTAYLSYYAKDEIKVLTDAKDEEIFFETVVSGFCLDGDLVEVNQLVVEVVMDSKYEDAASKIAEVINYYGTYFTNNVYVYFSIKDDKHAFSFMNQEKKDFEGEGIEFVEDEECECNCKHGGECTCGDECDCGDECTCHNDTDGCGCSENCKCREADGKCHCHEEGRECTCDEECSCHKEKHNCKCGC